MFIKLYRTRLKCLLKNYENLFRSFLFPVILAILFYMGFYNLAGNEKFNTIPVAVVNGGSIPEDFINKLKAAEVTEGSQLFEIRQCGREQAKELLADGKAAGYIIYEEDPKLYVNKNGMEQTIIKSWLDGYILTKRTAGRPGAADNDPYEAFAAYRNYAEDESTQGRNPDYSLISFYSIIALACIFGMKWGFRELIYIQADQSAIGARISIAPVRKLKLLLCNLSAAFTLHFAGVLILLAFLYKVLRIGFGASLWRVLLTCFTGSLCGVMLGAMVCVTVNANIRVREAILNIILIGGGFLSGIAAVDMKYAIEAKVPVIGYLNPVSLITDALYSLYYFEGSGRFFIKLGMLGLLAFIFALLTFMKIRRRVYASI